MPIVPFKELMSHAEQGQYAVGYFESWNLESLQAVADAAEATGSPVILGFSGLYLTHPRRMLSDCLSDYAALGLEVCRRLTVPTCLLFNESPNIDWVLEAVDLGFGLVMFADDNLPFEEQVACIRRVVDKAHSKSVAVEAEIAAPPGLNENISAQPDQPLLTEASQARDFVARTGADTLAVNIGQAHLHGRAQVRLDLQHLLKLTQAVEVPLVLHGASSVFAEDLSEAARLGIRKINVGSNLKRAYFDALRKACQQVGQDYHPYDVIGSGLPEDVLAIGRVALQKTVEDMMRLFGSAGRV